MCKLGKIETFGVGGVGVGEGKLVAIANLFPSKFFFCFVLFATAFVAEHRSQAEVFVCGHCILPTPLSPRWAVSPLAIPDLVLSFI